jgi:putative FmdB family regulatory protein
MPIYEYVCDDCQAQFEKIVINKQQEIACPKCASKKSHHPAFRLRHSRQRQHLFIVRQLLKRRRRLLRRRLRLPLAACGTANPGCALLTLS